MQTEENTASTLERIDLVTPSPPDTEESHTWPKLPSTQPESQVNIRMEGVKYHNKKLEDSQHATRKANHAPEGHKKSHPIKPAPPAQSDEEPSSKMEEIEYTNTKLGDSQHAHQAMIERKNKDTEMIDTLPMGEEETEMTQNPNQTQKNPPRTAQKKDKGKGKTNHLETPQKEKAKATQATPSPQPATEDPDIGNTEMDRGKTDSLRD
ncbi:hypothetical protein BDZ91DRAFT_798516 [Kalaharituber pfeilii]|nr:hypothetical protein BDZ91DRAFT_798516 [Kalaharituber pfeilii]